MSTEVLPPPQRMTPAEIQQHVRQVYGVWHVLKYQATLREAFEHHLRRSRRSLAAHEDALVQNRADAKGPDTECEKVRPEPLAVTDLSRRLRMLCGSSVATANHLHHSEETRGG